MDKTNHTIELNIERLESRAMLAGNISVASQGNGAIAIRGDNEANSLNVWQEGDFLRFRGTDNTTINGTSNDLMTDFVVEGLRIDMRGGNDTVQLRKVVIDGGLNIRLKQGNDNLVAVDTRVGERLAVNGAGGEDAIEFDNVLAAGGATINTGSGNNNMSWRGGFTSGARVRSGSGNDTLLMSFFSDDDLSLRTSGGADFVGLGLGFLGLSGNTDVGLGGGDDELVVNQLTLFNDNVRFRGNGGTDKLTSDDSFVFPSPPLQFEETVIVSNAGEEIQPVEDGLENALLARIGAVITNFAAGNVSFTVEGGEVAIAGTATFTNSAGDFTQDSAGALVTANGGSRSFLGDGSTSTGGVDGFAEAFASFGVTVNESGPTANLNARGSGSLATELALRFYAEASAYVETEALGADGTASIFAITDEPISLNFASDIGPLQYYLRENGGDATAYSNTLPDNSSGVLAPGNFEIEFEVTASDDGSYEYIGYEIVLTIPTLSADVLSL